MSTQRTLNAYCMALLLVLFGVCASDAGVPYKPRQSRPSLDLNAAEDLIDELRRLGPRLHAILADEKRPIRSRCQCARLIGRMRYRPGIESLIRHIAVMDPDVKPDSNDWRTQYPCVAALQSFEDASIPFVMNSLSTEKEPSSQLLLGFAVAPRSRRKAQTYLKGFMGGTRNKRVRVKPRKDHNRLPTSVVDIRSVKRLVQRLEKLGPKLNAVIADERQPLRLRCHCARLIGETGFPPGVQTLVRFADLMDPDAKAVSDDWSVKFPCIQGLAGYGHAAIPSVTEAFVTEDKRPRHVRLALAIHRSSYQMARIYLRGLVAESAGKIPADRVARCLAYTKK